MKNLITLLAFFFLFALTFSNVNAKLGEQKIYTIGSLFGNGSGEVEVAAATFNHTTGVPTIIAPIYYAYEIEVNEDGEMAFDPINHVMWAYDGNIANYIKSFDFKRGVPGPVVNFNLLPERIFWSTQNNTLLAVLAESSEPRDWFLLSFAPGAGFTVELAKHKSHGSAEVMNVFHFDQYTNTLFWTQGGIINGSLITKIILYSATIGTGEGEETPVKQLQLDIPKDTPLFYFTYNGMGFDPVEEILYAIIETEEVRNGQLKTNFSLMAIYMNGTVLRTPIKWPNNDKVFVITTITFYDADSKFYFFFDDETTGASKFCEFDAKKQTFKDNKCLTVANVGGYDPFNIGVGAE